MYFLFCILYLYFVFYLLCLINFFYFSLAFIAYYSIGVVLGYFYYLIFTLSVSFYMNKPPTIKLITLQPKPNPNYIPKPPTPPPSSIPINHTPIQTHAFLTPPSNSPLIPSFSIELSEAMITIQQLM